jgi:hypothetical protein
MNNILREERYIVVVGAREHVFRIQELLSDNALCAPGRFRLDLPASDSYNARTFHGNSSLEVAKQAVDYLESSAVQGSDSSLTCSPAVDAISGITERHLVPSGPDPDKPTLEALCKLVEAMTTRQKEQRRKELYEYYNSQQSPRWLN